MPRKSASVLKQIMLLSILAIMTTNCAHRSFAKPAGKEVGSCKGSIQLTSGGQSRFILKLYHSQNPENDQFKLYFMLPGKTGLLPVEDLDFDEDTIRVVTGSRKTRVFEGTISGSPLKFKGEIKGFNGAFNLDLKQFIDQ